MGRAETEAAADRSGPDLPYLINDNPLAENVPPGDNILLIASPMYVTNAKNVECIV